MKTYYQNSSWFVHRLMKLLRLKETVVKNGYSSYPVAGIYDKGISEFLNRSIKGHIVGHLL